MEFHNNYEFLEIGLSEARSLASISDKNVLNSNRKAENYQKKWKNFEKESILKLNSIMEKISSHSQPSHHHTNASITLPYDATIQKIAEKEKNLSKLLKELSIVDSSLKEEKASFEKTQSALLKEKGKIEKDKLMLREEAQKQASMNAEVQKKELESQERLSVLNKQFMEENEKKVKLEQEELDSKNAYNDCLQLNIPNAESQMITDQLATLDEFYSDLNNNSSNEIMAEIPDFEEIIDLFNQFKSSMESQKDILNTLAGLEEQLGDHQLEIKSVRKDINKLKGLQGKQSFYKEELKLKKSALEEIQRKIDYDQDVLNSLKVVEKAAKPDDYLRPRNSRKESVFRKLPIPERSMQHDSDTLDTRKNSKTMLKNESTRHSNPGIRLLKVPNRDSDEESENSFDDGTTQDESGVNAFFGQLSDEKEESPTAVEFSMAAHLTEFSQRQAAAAAKMNMKTPEKKVVEIESDEDDDLDSSIIAPNRAKSKDDRKSDDSDDDLNDEEGDADQSIWGSDD